MNGYQGQRNNVLRRFFFVTPRGNYSQIFTAPNPLVAFTAASYKGGSDFVVYEAFDNQNGAAIPVTQSVDGMYCPFNWGLYESQKEKKAQAADRWFIVHSGTNSYPVVATSGELAYTVYRDFVSKQGHIQHACSCFVYDGVGQRVGRTMGFRWYATQVFCSGSLTPQTLTQKYFVLTAGGKLTEITSTDATSAYEAIRKLFDVRGSLPCVVFDGSTGYSTRVLGLHDGQMFHTRIDEDLLTSQVAKLTQRK